MGHITKALSIKDEITYTKDDKFRNIFIKKIDLIQIRFKSAVPGFIIIIPFLYTSLSAYGLADISIGGGIQVANYPFGISINPKNDLVYVTNSQSDTISVIDSFTGSIKRTLKVGSSPYDIAINPITNMIYVTNSNSSFISVINGTDNEVVNKIYVNGPQYGIVINPSTNRLYVISNFHDIITGVDSQIIYVIDSSKDKVLDAIQPGEYNGLSLNPKTNLIYVTNRNSDSLSVIDGISNRVIGSIKVGKQPQMVSINPKTNLIYVTNRNSDSLSVIDGISNRVIGNITLGRSPYGIAVNPELNVLYVSNNNSSDVSVIDGSSNKVIRNLDSGTYPANLKVNSQNNAVFVTMPLQGSVLMFNGSTLSGISGIHFDIYPDKNSGTLSCNGHNIFDKSTILYTTNTNITCTAIPTKGFLFLGWGNSDVVNAGNVQTVSFELKEFISLTPHFDHRPVTFIFWIILIMIVILLAVSFTLSRMNKRLVAEYNKQIKELYGTFNLQIAQNRVHFDIQGKLDLLSDLANIRRQILNDLKSMRLAESDFGKLYIKISSFHYKIEKV